MMGTLHLDLYITLTQAVVAAVSTLLEYQRLEGTVVILNNACRDLSHLLVRHLAIARDRARCVCN